jgi:hypothetical protein
LARWSRLGRGVKAVGAGGSARANLAGRQQMQLLGYGCDETLQNPHLFFQLLAFSVPVTFRDEPLYGISGKVGDTARAALLTHAAKLTELVFRNPEIN